MIYFSKYNNHKVFAKLEKEKKVMKKILAIVLASAMVFSLAACGAAAQATPEQKEAVSEAAAAVAEKVEEKVEEAKAEAPAADAAAAPKVALCLPDIDQYWTGFSTAAIKALKEAGCEVDDFVYAKEDISTQLGQVEGYKNNGYDAVIVGITNGESYKEIMDAAGPMKVVFFNRAISDNSVLDGLQYIYAGMSEYDAGKAQGQWLADYFKDQGKTEVKGMMFKGPLGLSNVENRTQGAKDALEENGIKVNWVFEDTAEWDRTKAMDKFTQFQGTGTPFDFVVANNDEMALGVIEAMKAAGKTIDFPIVGIDATEVGCMAIENGDLAMTVNQDGPGQAKVVAAALMQMLAGEKPSEVAADNTIATTAQPVTKDNYKDVLANFQK